MERNEATSMTEADWLHLKPYGYAPGNYMATCRGCGLVVEWLDKRAIRCRKCAEQKYAEASAAPPVAPQTNAERLARALDAHIEGPDRLTMEDAIAIRDELRRLSADARRYAGLRVGAEMCFHFDHIDGRHHISLQFPWADPRSLDECDPGECLAAFDEAVDAAIDQAMDGK